MIAGAAAVKRIDPGEAARAIEWLKQTLDFTGEGALDYLDQLLSSSNILKVYQQMFPSLYGASTATTCGRDAHYTGHSPKEGEFLKIISRHYFTLPDDEGWQENEDHYDAIPVTPLQGDSWCCSDVEFDNLHACYYVSLCLFGGMEYWEHAVERYALGEDFAAPAGDIDFDSFAALCRAERSPLQHLPVAIDMMQYNTGNEWLDASFCSGVPSLPWSVPNILKLSRSYKEAQRAFDKVHELSRYLDLKPQEALKRALELWNGAARRKKNVSSGTGDDS